MNLTHKLVRHGSFRDISRGRKSQVHGTEAAQGMTPMHSHAVSLSTQDLRDRLWDICDARKEEAEQERLDIINESWLQDSVGITMNHFFSLMQVGAARHSDTDSLCNLIPHGATPSGMLGVCSGITLLITP